MISQVKRIMSKRNLNPHNVLLESDSSETCDEALKRGNLLVCGLNQTKNIDFSFKIMLQVYLCPDLFNLFNQTNK